MKKTRTTYEIVGMADGRPYRNEFLPSEFHLIKTVMKDFECNELTLTKHERDADYMRVYFGIEI